MNLFSSKAADEKLEEKRNALCTIILSKLKDAHNAKIEEIKNSEEFKNFEANLIKTDKEAAQLNSAVRAFETALDKLSDSLKGSKHYYRALNITQSHINTQISSDFEYFVNRKKTEAFPEAFNNFDTYTKYELIMAHLKVYADIKNSDKIVDKIIERLS